MTPTEPTAARVPLLLEIGSEEIPARFVPDAMAFVAERCETLLNEVYLDHAPLRVVATPRRLAVICDAVATCQPDREVELKGPPVSVAFAANGAPTRAGEAFASKAGIPLADCERAVDKRGEYLVARMRVAGRSTAEVLAEALPGVILAIPFRKVMRWGTGTIEYARPLQWIVCLLGTAVVDFTVGDLATGRETRGHRTLTRDRRRALGAASEYLPAMAELSVIVDPAERRGLIEAQASAAMAALPGPATWRADAELIAEVVQLCEHPTVFRGDYAEHYFALPREVIVTALKAHQRYFAVEGADGSALLPHFLAVRDGGGEHLDKVVAGNERVLRARLDDALFYWRFDQQKSPDEHTQGLATVTWLEGFGSVLDKTHRVTDLVAYLWERGLGDGAAVPAALTRAATIAKFDLVTEMIKDGKEFTKLEGVMAARYAAKAGEDAAVCRTIERFYLPRGAEGELPGDGLSSTLSIADRLDTLAGCWLAGFVPTGAKDPYALRRHTLAIIRTLLDREARIDLPAAIARALAPYASFGPKRGLEEAAGEIVDFVRVRLEGFVTESLGANAQVARAVLGARRLDPTDIAAWIRALERFRNRDDFLLLATGFKRCTNILEGQAWPPHLRAESLERWRDGGRTPDGGDFSDLPEPEERALTEAVAAAAAAVATAETEGDYVAVFELLSSLGPAIDRFFESVRVNVDDAVLRGRRHDFLREIHAVFSRFADFSWVAPGED